MYAERHSIPVTTAADGSATVYSPAVTGRILAVGYVKTDFTDGVDVTVTLEATGQAVLTWTNVNASVVVYPRVPVQDEAGADATSDGTRKLREPVVAVNDRVKFVVAAGGNAKIGTFYVVVG